MACGEAWREFLTIGDIVYVRSASAGGWLQGRVTQTAKTRVKVEYVVGSERCDKTLLRTSPDLRPASAFATAPGGAPGLAAPVQPQPQPVGANPVQPQPGGVAAVQPQQAVPQPPRRVVPNAGYAPAGAAAPVAAARLPEGSPHHQRDAAQIATPAVTPAVSAVSRPEGKRPTLSNLSLPPQGEWLKMSDLTLDEVLGSGGFGSVHKGTLRGEEVAIKKMHCLQEGCQIPQEQLDDFSKEVANLQGLRHPRLIRYVGVAIEPPVICIVTELAASGSLYHLLHQQQAHLDEAKRRELCLQIIEGVSFLHSRQPLRVHRDLKSANVVLDADLNAKLCDFGLTESMEKTHLSRRDTEGGSPRYMAPEVFDARRKLTEKIDIWALGCLIAEILTSTVPHKDCSTIQQVAAKLLVRREAPFQDAWAEHLHTEVRNIVTPCFAFSPDQRPSAQGLHDSLSALEEPLISAASGNGEPSKEEAEAVAS